LASPFGNPPPHGSGGQSPTPDRERDETATPDVDQSVPAAQQKFLTCRWRKPAENGVPDHCGHRDVLPMAGATGFVPDAWCPDCQYFKAKRTPRKREENFDRDRDWRW
jgi:hypothetical protein